MYICIYVAYMNTYIYMNMYKYILSGPTRRCENGFSFCMFGPSEAINAGNMLMKRNKNKRQETPSSHKCETNAEGFVGVPNPKSPCQG